MVRQLLDYQLISQSIRVSQFISQLSSGFSVIRSVNRFGSRSVSSLVDRSVSRLVSRSVSGLSVVDRLVVSDQLLDRAGRSVGQSFDRTGGRAIGGRSAGQQVGRSVGRLL